MAAANLIIVPDSPAVKRRRTEGGFQSTGNSTGYNSEEDSGDDLFEGITSTPPPSKYFTQPTQILERPAVPQSSPPPVRSPDIQIPASSPFRPQPVAVNQNTAPVPGRLASIMAPAGTSFRTPHGVVRAPAAKPKAKPILIDLLDDDDGPTYKGGSSDDDAASRANIRPSSFVTKASNTSFGSANGEPSSGNSRFSETMQSFKFGGPSKAGGGFPGTSTSINGLNTRPNGAQNRPARALGVEFDVTEEEEPDLVMRRKIRLVRSINPEAWSVITCRNAIMKCKGSVDDAAALLAAGTIELTDDDEIETPEKGIAKPKLPEPQMKAQLKAPVASIQARYSHNVSQTKKQSIPTVTVDATPPPKPKRKLMQGRRHASSPAPIPSPKVPSPQIIHINSDHEDYDSGVASEPEEDIELEGRVLKFLNTCTAQALADLTNIKETVAITMVNARPFSNLEAARSVSDAAVTKTGKRSTKAPVGEKVVQVAIDMWSGYEAVDALVARCEQLGKPLTAEMNKWPVDMFGEPQGGVDLSTLDVEDRDLQKDSAIGTPTSKANSHNGDVADDDVKAIKSRRGFLKEPKIMNPDYPLKKFQYVGLNWLALLYKHKLSCILADDMGLGKTCQVITFLSYLVETGVSGPHLVIVPPSTLENWLREFAKFSPSLVVEPYYGSQAERQEAAERMLDTRDEINVVVSTYEFAAKAQDNKFMRRLRPEVSRLAFPNLITY
jgi:SWI/SNF-related matrix-associated actin-dependent regulator 1 of chromatin subfamily A